MSEDSLTDKAIRDIVPNLGSQIESQCISLCKLQILLTACVSQIRQFQAKGVTARELTPLCVHANGENPTRKHFTIPKITDAVRRSLAHRPN